MNSEQKKYFLDEIRRYSGPKKYILTQLQIPRRTYYNWLKVSEEKGLAGLTDGRIMRIGSWNQLIPEEEKRVLEIARDFPVLSPRLLAVKITDEEEFSVSETKVYALLKQEGLIDPRPITDLPAAKEWHHKTTRLDEIWQCDATHYFIVGWGYYKQISVLDDYSRFIPGWDLKPDETAFSISEVLEQTIENARQLEHLLDGTRPLFLSDNGPGFTADLLANYLSAHGIRHIFGKPYHPQTQGKVERYQRGIKEKVCLLVYCSPEQLKQAIAQAVTQYNATPHKALNNVSPQDVYAGRKEEILRKRLVKKELTMARRKLYNLNKQKSVRSNP